MDESAMGWLCDSNSVENTAIAFYSNRNYKNSFKHNNVVNGDKYIAENYSCIYFKDQAVGNSTYSADRDTLRYNNFVLSSTKKATAYLRHAYGRYPNTGIDENKFYFDYNNIAAPFTSSPLVGKYLFEWGAGVNTYTLSQMQTDGGNVSSIPTDIHSRVNPQAISYSQVSNLVSEEEFIQFFTNFSRTTRTVNLGNAVFRDIMVRGLAGRPRYLPSFQKFFFTNQAI